jgi:hypothetical protein
MNQSELDGKTLTLLLMGETQTGEQDWSVFRGTVRAEAAALYLDRGASEPRVEIREEWLARVKPVTPDLAETLLRSELYLPLSVGNVANEAVGDLVPLGLKWPK